MSKADITVYGAYWCPDCRRSKQFLGEHQIPYNWVNIEEDAEAEHFVIEKNDGKRIIPTIVFADDTFLIEPTNAELAAKLELRTKASRSHYDLIVLGGGPAGLTAALYTAREAIDTLVIERAAFGGQAAGTEKLDNMPGFPDGVSGIEFSQRLRQQSERFGAELLQAQEIASIYQQDNYHCVQTGDGSIYSADALLIATGSRYKRLNIPGETDYLGAGVHFCATCDGPFYKGKHVAVIGGGNTALDAARTALRLTGTQKVILVYRRSEEEMPARLEEIRHAKQEGVTFQFLASPLEIKGDNGWVTDLICSRMELGEPDASGRKQPHPVKGSEFSLSVDAVVIALGSGVNPLIAKSASDLKTDTKGHIELADPDVNVTYKPGVFAGGDIVTGAATVISAMGAGKKAAAGIHEYLMHS